MQWICYNGDFLPHQQPVFTAANRSFRYGDGVFETARFYKGRLLLAPAHFERLFSGLQMLNITANITAAQLQNHIEELCARNCCTALARVRIAAYRDADDNASFVIEATALAPDALQWKAQGWRVVLFPHAQNSCDRFANLKSANYLPYVMAGRYAAAHNADECLVLNVHNRIADGNKTNLFLVKKNEVFTPALSEGPVAGVMRRTVMGFLKSLGYAVHETAATKEDVLQADAVFLTNAIEGLRWVRQFEHATFEQGLLKSWYADFIKTLYGEKA